MKISVKKKKISKKANYNWMHNSLGKLYKDYKHNRALEVCSSFIYFLTATAAAATTTDSQKEYPQRKDPKLLSVECKKIKEKI